MQRREFIKKTVSGTLAAIAMPVGLSARQTKRQPNIVYINVDDLGWTDLGVMGSRYYETPNIDQLASEGVLFTNAYAPAANCAPSRACCMSGQYSPRHEVYTVGSSERSKSVYRKLIPTPNQEILPDKTLTLAEVLKAGGYTTCHAGKWNLGEDPRTQGFDVNIGGSTYGKPESYFSPYDNEYLTDGPEGEYLTDRLADEVLEFLDANHAQPFFLHFAFYTVHTPTQSKAAKEIRFQAKKGDRQHNRADYAGMIASMDENVGRVLKKIDNLGIRDDTLVLFMSDNGGVFRLSRQWPLRAGKGSYYEGGIREPMIVRWPGVARQGRKCEVPVSGIDFFPTFLDAAGLPVPEEKSLDGVSLMPLIKNSGSFPNRALFWHFPVYLGNGNGETGDPLFRTRPGSAVRYGHWKLIEYFEDGRLELYHLDTDLGERHNLVQLMPQKAEELHEMLKEWRRKTGAPVPTRKNPDYEPDIEKKDIDRFYGL